MKLLTAAVLISLLQLNVDANENPTAQALQKKHSEWYVDGGPQPCQRATKMPLLWPGQDRCSTIGFRCVVDRKKGNDASVIKQDIPDKLVVLSFDDSRKDNYSFIAPLLKEYGFGATFYICEFPEFEDKTRFMTWRQIKKLADMGFEIGNHTQSHIALKEASQQEFAKQVTYIEEQCNRWGIDIPTTFAYPGGRVGNDITLRKMLTTRGYTFARTVHPEAYNPLKDNPLLLPSYCVHSNNLNRLSEFLSEARNGNIVILTMHGVSDTEQYRVSTSTAHFLDLLKYLKENDYSVIAMRDLNKYVDVEKAINLIDIDDQQERMEEINRTPGY